MSRTRGVALIELIVASMVFALAMLAMFQAWRLCFSLSIDGQERARASQIARAELEMSKIQGFNNLPIGTLASAGSFNGRWSEPAQYYGATGELLERSAVASKRTFYSIRSGFDRDVLREASGSSYTLGPTTRRSVVVKVYRVLDDVELIKMGVHISRGGL